MGFWKEIKDFDIPELLFFIVVSAMIITGLTFSTFGVINFMQSSEHIGFTIRKKVDGNFPIYYVYKVTTNWPDEVAFITPDHDLAMEKLKAMSELPIKEH